MTRVAPTPELKSAIVKGALAEGVLLGAGAVLFLTTQSVIWVIGGMLAGAAAMLFFLAQAGLFDRRDE